MSLLPREHGAYGQASVPLATAFVVAGPSLGGACVAIAVIAGLLAHEPAAILLGARGPRARREQGDMATRWLVTCLGLGGAAGLGAVWVMAAARWSLVIPAVPALVLVVAMLRQREKSWYGEATAALAFSAAAIPVVCASGASLATGIAVGLPFALLFVSTTLAVRVVILRVRGGGDPRAAAAHRAAAIILALASTMLLVVAARAGRLPWSLVMAAAPGLLTALGLALHPPSPTRLRVMGWTLVAVTVLTAVLIVALTSPGS